MSQEPVCLVSVGTAVPNSIFPLEDFIKLQQEAADFAISQLDENNEEQAKRIGEIRTNLKWVVSCAKNSQIKKRHGIVPEEGEKLQDFYKTYDYNPPYTLRAKYWRKYCPSLAMEAVNKALKEWGGDVKKITHVVSHSTTGWDVPGLSHHVIYNLKLPVSARAVPVNFVGCQGGTSVMYVAAQIARQEPNAVVLALAAEIQSPLGRMYNDVGQSGSDKISLERSIYMPNVLFGDAAACSVICRPRDNPSSNKFPAFVFGNMGAHYCPNTRHVLTISVSEEYGLYYENSIKKELPIHLNNALTKYFPKWLESCVGNKKPNEVAYAVHPGGLKLLMNFSKLLEDLGVENGEEECKYSFYNLRTYGNLASAAILFILSDVCRNTKKDQIYFMAMGPGVCLEYGGLTRYDPNNNNYNTSSRTSSNDSNMTPLLLVIIVALVAFIFSGFTVADIANML
jgi:chalcone synthase